MIVYSLPPNTPLDIRNEISLPTSPPTTPLVPVKPPDSPETPEDGTSPPVAPGPRYVEPISMIDLANEENDQSELEEAMTRQKRAKHLKSRVAKKRAAMDKATSPEPDTGDEEFDVEGQEPSDSDDGSKSGSETGASSSDKSRVLDDSSSTRQQLDDSSLTPIDPNAPTPATDSPAPAPASRSPKIWFIAAGLLVIVGVLAAVFQTQLKTLIAGKPSVHTHVTDPGNVLPATIDARLPRAEVTPVPVLTHPDLSAVPLQVIPPVSSPPIPAVTRISAAPRVTSLQWHLAPAPTTGDVPAFTLETTPTRVAVIVRVDASITPAGKLRVAELTLQNDELIWRWLFTAPWPEKLRQDWAQIAPLISQSLVELTPAPAAAAKIQFMLPIERTLQSDTGSSVISDPRAATPATITVLPLSTGWKAADSAEAGKTTLELTHPTGAHLTINAILSRSIWTVLAAWPTDSQPDQLVASIARIEQQIASLLALKTSPEAIAEIEADIKRVVEELEPVTSRLNQLKSQKPEPEPATIASLETRRGELNASVTQLRAKLDKSKSAPTAIEALRTQRKAESDRLEAVRILLRSRICVVSQTTQTVLAVVNFGNASAGAESASSKPAP